MATLYRWLRKKADGESLKPAKNSSFIRKIDPEMLAEYVKKHPDHTLMEMKHDLGFGISSIWYRLKQLKITLKKRPRFTENGTMKIENNLLTRLPK
ncbi:IS630 transposase-related protein [Wolbachia endosymbiont (group E) of Neria commutata]|uniref:IS630 transposase-related protein n=1 Tax=Wolbachia endosymbiont (group E) of Neria commutata TaxID=3066149 RepID=UPI0031334546